MIRDPPLLQRKIGRRLQGFRQLIPAVVYVVRVLAEFAIVLTGVDGERQQLRRGDGSGGRGGDGVVVGDHGRWLDGEGV